MAAGSGTSLTYAGLLREVREDWHAARESKQEAEERAIENYRLYRCFRKDVETAGSVGEAVKGPFGWSKLTIPIIYWTVEAIVPRVAVNTPTLIVEPRTPESVPYAQAKELELQDTLEQMRVRRELHMALKQTVLYGDGPTKTTWDAERMMPRFTTLSWFDWFLSPEARRPDEAEVIFHRSWYTRRQLQRLSRVRDRNGKPLWWGLEEVTGSETIESGDTTYASRREAAGIGTPSWAAEGGLYCLIECWYQDGTVVVLGGASGDRIVQVRTSPYRDEYGRPVRPFVVFSNTPDPESPYAIGDAEMLQDHQTELSTLRNQAIDQTTVNINAPIIYSGNVTKQEIDAAFGQPGGSLRVNGDVTRQVMRMTPGAVSADFFNFYSNVREEGQIVSGVNENQAGQSAPGRQTATEIEVINTEANRRWQFKIVMVEEAFSDVGKRIDLLERRYGAPGKALVLPPTATNVVRTGQAGLAGFDGMPMEPGALLQGATRTSPMVNAPGTEYRVSVKAGTLSLPSDREEFQKAMTMVQALSANDLIAQNVDWRNVAKIVASVTGFPAEKLLISDEQLAQQQMEAALQEAVMAQSASEPAMGPAPASEPAVA